MRLATTRSVPGFPGGRGQVQVPQPSNAESVREVLHEADGGTADVDERAFEGCHRARLTRFVKEAPRRTAKIDKQFGVTDDPEKQHPGNDYRRQPHDQRHDLGPHLWSNERARKLPDLVWTAASPAQKFDPIPEAKHLTCVALWCRYQRQHKPPRVRGMLSGRPGTSVREAARGSPSREGFQFPCRRQAFSDDENPGARPASPRPRLGRQPSEIDRDERPSPLGVRYAPAKNIGAETAPRILPSPQSGVPRAGLRHWARRFPEQGRFLFRDRASIKRGQARRAATLASHLAVDDWQTNAAPAISRGAPFIAAHRDGENASCALGPAVSCMVPWSDAAAGRPCFARRSACRALSICVIRSVRSVRRLAN